MEKLTIVNCTRHNKSVCEHCPNYIYDVVLPDEDGKCSLCGQHEA